MLKISKTIIFGRAMLKLLIKKHLKGQLKKKKVVEEQALKKLLNNVLIKISQTLF
jgi:hypothetical protein